MNTSVKIKEEIKKLSDKFCQEEERSMSYLINKALQEYLEDWYDYKLAEEGYKRYVENGSKGVSIEEVAKMAGIDLRKL